MPRKWSERILERVQLETQWHRSRCECFAQLVCAVIMARSVRLDDLAACTGGKAKSASKARRFQYFFNDFNFCYEAIARLVVAILGDRLGKRWTLAMDRTNWTRRGQEVNILTLGICMGDVAIPVFWVDLGKRGNSDSGARIRLVKRFISVFGVQRIHALVGDREFVGRDWFNWLQKQDIPYVFRIRENFQVRASQGQMTQVRHCFRNLPIGASRCLGNRRVGGATQCLGGIRLPGNEFVLLASHGLGGEAAMALYRDRWQIETLFQKLKGHGFDLELSRLRGDGKYEKLMAVLAVASAWSYAMGHWSVTTICPIRLKSHGRRAKAVWRQGLDTLRSVLTRCSTEIQRCSRVALSILNRQFQPLLRESG